MKLLNLKLKDFKGIRDLEINPQGRSVSIYGENSTGKTTIADAFHWLLFNKDSLGKTDFDIKTLDTDGKAIPGLDHTVEAELDLDGRRLSLKKTYREVWTKKRGSATRELTGHTTDHFIDGVPAKKAEYDAAVKAIADEDIFKLLTNPLYFNNQLHWQDRRQLLLEVCGDISDADIIASDKALAALPAILGNRAMEDHRKVIRSRMTEINRELDRIPVRIDEATRALPELPEGERLAYANAVNIERSLKESKAERRVRMESGGEVAEKKKALAEMDAGLMGLRNELRAGIGAALDEEYKAIRQIERGISTHKETIRRGHEQAEALKKQIEAAEAEMDRLRERWNETNNQVLSAETVDICPACGQPLPPEKVEEAHRKATEDFNRTKAESLETISKSGKAWKGERDGLKQRLQDVEIEYISTREDLAEAEIKLSKAQRRAEALEKQLAEVEQDPDYKNRLQERQALMDAIEALQAGGKDELDALLAEIAEVNERLRKAEQDLAKFDARGAGEKRIRELQEQERELAEEYEKLEHEQHLCEQFTRAKVKLLDEKINNRFKLARFKLFNELVNGGLEECCETTFDGVSWDKGLNSGALVKVGLDIINTLSEHYAFSAPIFVDNSEGVTDELSARGQLIRLVVSKEDKTLRVEAENE